MSRTIRFAVVGCGHIGKRHIEMIQRNKESELIALVDTKEPHELELGQLIIPLYRSIKEMLDKHPNVDVVNIASPNGLHAVHALECLEERKHVVIEKPMALRKQDAERVIFKALQVNRHVFTVMQNRYSPPSVWIKEIIEEGRLGNIYMVLINCFWNRDEKYYNQADWHGSADLDGGTLFTQFSHFIDIMYWLFGDIDDIQVRFADFNHSELTDFEDSGIVSFRFVNQGMGCINYSTSVWNRNLESSMTILGEKGSVKISGQYMNEIEICHIQNYEMPVLESTNPENDYGNYKGSAANHHYIIENVIDVLNNRATISTNALEGLKVVDIIERIYRLKH